MTPSVRALSLAYMIAAFVLCYATFATSVLT
jgi:hypothetical protein